MTNPATKFLDELQAELSERYDGIGGVTDPETSKVYKAIELARHSVELAEATPCIGDVCYPERLCYGCLSLKPYQSTVDSLPDVGGSNE